MANPNEHTYSPSYGAMPDENSHELANLIATKLGYERASYIASGTKGSAYMLNEKTVLKLTSDRTEYVECSKLVGKKNKHLQDIYKVFYLKGQNGVYGIIGEFMTNNQEAKQWEDKAAIQWWDHKFFDVSKELEDCTYVKHLIFSIVYRDGISNETMQKMLIKAKPYKELFSYLSIINEIIQNNIKTNDCLASSNLGFKQSGNFGCFDFSYGKDEKSNPKIKYLSVAESNKNLLNEFIKKTINEELSWADASRADMIRETLSKMKNDPDYNTEEPELAWLLDPYDGYPMEIYIQNNLSDGEIILFEGWSSLCWKAIYNKPQYRGRSKEKVLEKIFHERMPELAKECCLTLKNCEYFWEETWDDDVPDGYIMKITFGVPVQP